MSELPAEVTEFEKRIDRVGDAPSIIELVVDHLDGRYTVDEFGADTQFEDFVAPWFDRAIRVEVEGAHQVPLVGSAVLVCNRGVGVAEPAVVTTAVRQATGRRLRVVGSSSVPGLDFFTRKIGVIGYDPSEVAACLRAGHLVAMPLGRTWVRSGAGTPPIGLMLAALGHPVYPCAIRPCGPFNIPLRPWEITIGEPIHLDTGDHPVGDRLAAAELATRVQAEVALLLS